MAHEHNTIYRLYSFDLGTHQVEYQSESYLKNKSIPTPGQILVQDHRERYSPGDQYNRVQLLYVNSYHTALSLLPRGAQLALLEEIGKIIDAQTGIKCLFDYNS